LKEWTSTFHYRSDFRNAAFIAVLLPIGVSGVGYMSQFNREALSTSPSMQKLAKLDSTYHFDDFVMLSHWSNDRAILGEKTLSVYIPFNWANTIDVSKPYNQSYLDKPVILVYKTRDLKCQKCWQPEKYRFVVETDDFLLLGLNRTLRDVYDPKTNLIHTEDYLNLETL
jgi:hypothetical protein